MKTTALFAALLCLAQSSLHAAVPLFINYQGHAIDASGLPLGASGTVAAPVAAPINRKVLFRFWDASTGGNLKWSEEQTVTISLGDFSVLLGQGIAPTGTAAGEVASRPSLDSVFTSGSDVGRYLEIMVHASSSGTFDANDSPVSPRQQITSSAFAVHAQVADGIASGSDLAVSPLTGTATNYGLGWYGGSSSTPATYRPFNGVAVDGPVLYGNSGGALGSTVGTTKNIALLWNAAGQVGIGTTSSFAAANKLILQGDDASTPAQQLVIRGNTTPAERLNIGFDTTLNQATLQSYTATSTAGNLLLNPSGGNIGIGSAATPNAKLTIGTPIGDTTTTTSLSFSTNAGTLGQTAGSELLLGNFGFSDGDYDSFSISGYRTAAGTNWADTALVLGRNVDSTKRAAGSYLSLHYNGGVGIGTLTPGYKLDVNGTARVVGSLIAGGLSVGGAQVETASSSTAVADIGGGDVHTYFGSYTGTNSYATWLQALRPSDQLTFPMAINPNGGNVGIGNANPAFKLDVNGTARVSQNLTLNSQLVMADGACIYAANTAGVLESAFYPRSGNGTYINYGSNGFYIRNNASVNTMSMTTDGTVSMGNAYSNALFNVGNKTSTYAEYGYLATGGATGTNGTRTNYPLSIHANGAILATSFDVDSDTRIKTHLRPTDSLVDLQTLMGIAITDYHYKDTIANGDIQQKKVIAQQLKKIYPQAVHIRKGVVPDIYQNAEIKDEWVMLATDLKAGERVRLILATGDSIEEVLEVRDGAFRSSLKAGAEKAFVYGREVEDFHSVDYDAIAMLNVSATQQIKREKDAEVQALQEKSATEIAALKSENSKLRQQLAATEKSLEARLIAIEERLSKDHAVKAGPAKE